MKFMRNSLSFLISTEQNLLRLLRRIDHSTVYFEGGMGSQLLALIEWQLRVNEYNEGKGSKYPQLDITYFSNTPKILSSGLVIWKWELERYGVTLQELQKYQIPKIYKYLRARPNINEQSTQDTINLRRNSASLNIKVPSDVTEFARSVLKLEFLEEDTNEIIDCCTVHIRRGDYLSVATHLVEFGVYLHLLSTIKEYIPSRVIIFCDTEIDQMFKIELARILNNKRLYWCDSDSFDSGKVHDFMRASKILITANSTFSISAGLLSDDRSIVFAPLCYFGQVSARNNPFLGLGDYFLFG